MRNKIAHVCIQYHLPLGRCLAMPQAPKRHRTIAADIHSPYIAAEDIAQATPPRPLDPIRTAQAPYFYPFAATLLAHLSISSCTSKEAPTSSQRNQQTLSRRKKDLEIACLPSRYRTYITCLLPLIPPPSPSPASPQRTSFG